MSHLTWSSEVRDLLMRGDMKVCFLRSVRACRNLPVFLHPHFYLAVEAQLQSRLVFAAYLGWRHLLAYHILHHPDGKQEQDLVRLSLPDKTKHS